MADARTVYVVTYNHDYNESASCFRTRAEAVAEIAESFETTEKQDTPAFWQEVMDNYEGGNWKGFAFYMLDLDTLKMLEVAHG